MEVNRNLIKQYTWIINLFFITILTYVSVHIFFSVLRSKMEIPPGIKTVLAKKEIIKKEELSADYYKIISQRNLFNSNPPPPPSLVPPPPEAPVSAFIPPPSLPPLNLKLMGTIASDPKNSFAVILNNKTNKQDLFTIGDEVENSIVIDIQRNKVLIKRGENIETLSLEEKDALGNIASANQGKPINKSMPGAPPLPHQGNTGEIKQVGQNTWSIPRGEVTGALGNLSQLMTEALLRPNFEEGRPAGFMFAQVKPGSIFEQIGIRKGDIIKKINGVTLNTPQEALEFYGRLQTETMIQLEVERDHQMKSFVYNIN